MPDGDRAPLRSGEIDVIDADRAARDHPQLRTGGDQRRVDAVREQAEQTLGLASAVRERARRRRARAFPNREIAVLGQPFQGGAGEPARSKDPRPGAHAAPVARRTARRLAVAQAGGDISTIGEEFARLA